MSQPNQFLLSPPPSYQLMRKQDLLKKIPISKSTLHAWLDPKSRYHNRTLPRPIYFPGSRIPYWDEAAVDAWIASAAGEAIESQSASEASASEQQHEEQAARRFHRVSMQASDGSPRHVLWEVRKPRHQNQNRVFPSAAN